MRKLICVTLALILAIVPTFSLSEASGLTAIQLLNRLVSGIFDSESPDFEVTIDTADGASFSAGLLPDGAESYRARIRYPGVEVSADGKNAVLTQNGESVGIRLDEGSVEITPDGVNIVTPSAAPELTQADTEILLALWTDFREKLSPSAISVNQIGSLVTASGEVDAFIGQVDAAVLQTIKEHSAEIDALLLKFGPALGAEGLTCEALIQTWQSLALSQTLKTDSFLTAMYNTDSGSWRVTVTGPVGITASWNGTNFSVGVKAGRNEWLFDSEDIAEAFNLVFGDIRLSRDAFSREETEVNGLYRYKLHLDAMKALDDIEKGVYTALDKNGVRLGELLDKYRPILALISPEAAKISSEDFRVAPTRPSASASFLTLSRNSPALSRAVYGLWRFLREPIDVSVEYDRDWLNAKFSAGGAKLNISRVEDRLSGSLKFKDGAGRTYSAALEARYDNGAVDAKLNINVNNGTLRYTVTLKSDAKGGVLEWRYRVRNEYGAENGGKVTFVPNGANSVVITLYEVSEGCEKSRGFVELCEKYGYHFFHMCDGNGDTVIRAERVDSDGKLILEAVCDIRPYHFEVSSRVFEGNVDLNGHISTLSGAKREFSYVSTKTGVSGYIPLSILLSTAPARALTGYSLSFDVDAENMGFEVDIIEERTLGMTDETVFSVMSKPGVMEIISGEDSVRLSDVTEQIPGLVNALRVTVGTGGETKGMTLTAEEYEKGYILKLHEGGIEGSVMATVTFDFTPDPSPMPQPDKWLTKEELAALMNQTAP